MTFKARVVRFSILISSLVLALSGQAQSLGEKPIKIYLGYAPGGGSDLTARLYAQKLQELLKTPVIVENKPGAFEQLAAQPVMVAPPDGHTLWFGTTGALTMGPGVRSSVPYDVIKNFAHVGKIAEVEAVVVVRNGVPAKTLPELISYARANPGKLNYASAGYGSGNHLMTEYILGLTNVAITHVPYKSDPDVVREIAGGHADFGIVNLFTGTPFVKEGRVKALAVSGAERSKALPAVPSFAEEGGVESLRNYGTFAIYALLAPAGTPPDIVRTLNEALNKISQMPDVIQKLDGSSIKASYSTPDELKKYLVSEIAKWKEVGKKVKVD